ncbi:MAG: TOBE domain-containing protein [Burkholderiales bacterium]|nr:TOBE domain-containing protein [Burkholderiales bacterium]
MKTSARNEFSGTIQSIVNGAVNTEVVLDIGEGHELVSVITHDSAASLGLKVGGKAIALVKAPWVIVTRADSKLRTSARNKLCGVVAYCHEGAVNGEVIIDLGQGKQLAAIITNESLKGLGLEAGIPACAHIKASHIVLAVEE